MSRADVNSSAPQFRRYENLAQQITCQIACLGGSDKLNRISKSTSWFKKPGGGECGGTAAGPDERNKGQGNTFTQDV